MEAESVRRVDDLAGVRRADGDDRSASASPPASGLQAPPRRRARPAARCRQPRRPRTTPGRRGCGSRSRWRPLPSSTASTAAVCQSFRWRTSGRVARAIAATACENARKRRSLSGQPVPSARGRGAGARCPGRRPGETAPTWGWWPRRTRAGPTHSGTPSSSTVSRSSWVAAVVRQHDLDVDLLAAQLGVSPADAGRQTADDHERGELGRSEQHAHRTASSHGAERGDNAGTATTLDGTECAVYD